MRSMRNAGGYVRLHRSMLDWEWYDDDACVRVMLHLLLTANWEEKKWHGQTIAPGQLVTSMEGVAKKLGLSRSSVRRAFDRLKSTGEIAIHTNNHWTTVTLANWAEYQELPPTNGLQKRQQTTDQRPTSDRPVATTKEVLPTGSTRREEEREARTRTVDDRKADFVAACKAITDAQPERLSRPERKGFLAFWTEMNATTGRMRFEDQKYFDHGRRMDTWQGKADKDGAPATETEKSTIKSYRV